MSNVSKRHSEREGLLSMISVRSSILILREEACARTSDAPSCAAPPAPDGICGRAQLHISGAIAFPAIQKLNFNPNSYKRG